MTDIEKSVGGRPTSFNQERAEKIIMAVRGGNYLKTAANYAGVHPATLNRWLQKADDPNAPDEFRHFRDDLEKARADAEVAALAKINLASSNGNWQAAAWYLERSHPERWGRTDTARIEIVDGSGGPTVAGVLLTAEGMSALAQRLAQRQAEDEQDIIDAEVIEEFQKELEAAPSDIVSDSELEAVLDVWGEDEDDDDE